MSRRKEETLSLGEIRQTYYDATATASEIARQLAFAGIALIWVLSGGALSTAGKLELDADLLRAGFLLVLALALDLLQYLYRSLAWGIYGRLVENRKDAEARPSVWMNRPALWLFVGKVLAAMAAYVLLLLAVGARLA